MIRALKFNGTDTHISLGDSASVSEMIPEAFCIEAWVRRDIPQEWTAFAGILEDDGVREKGWTLGLAGGRPAFGLATKTGRKLVWAKGEKEDWGGKWRHMAGVYDGKEMALYVDGDLKARAKNSGAVLYPEKGEFVIGAFKDATEFYPFAGNIAEVRLWKTALSRDALAVKKDIHLDPGEHPDLAGCWPLIDGAGRVIQNRVESGQNGRVNGGAQWEDRGGLSLSGRLPVPAPPSNLTAEDIRDDRFTAKWENVSGARAYLLDVAADAEFKTPVQGFSGLETAETSVAVTGLEGGKTYFWRVACKTLEDTGKPGGVKETRTRVFAIPDANWAVSFPEDETRSTFIDFGKIEDVKAALPKEALTIEAWVRPDDWGDAGIFGVIGKDGEEKKGWLLGIKNKKFFFSVSGKDTDGAGDSGVLTELVSKKGFASKKWLHAAGVCSGKEMELYINGERICGTKKSSGDIHYPADEKGNFFAGRAMDKDGKPSSFKGMMSEIRLWNEALSQGDIQKRMEYRVKDPGKEKNLLGWWPLSSGSGSDISDIKGNLHGRLSGRAEWADAGDLCLFWPLEDAVQVAAGLRHTLALKKDGAVWAWGAGSRGQLGDGSYQARYSPVMVKDSQGKKHLTGIKEIAAGHFHSLALDKDGRVWAWGDHSLLQLGNEELKESSSPLPVRVALTGVKSLSALSDFSLALKNDGTVWAWGSNDKSGLGSDPASAGEKSAAPLQVKADNSYSHLEEIVQIAAGKYHGLALDKNGRVWAWGDNGKNQTGGPSTHQAFVVKDVDGRPLSGIVSIAAGKYHSLAAHENGEAYAWGDNAHGQAGDPDKMALYAPTRLKDEKGVRLSGVKKVFAGYDHSMAETGDKTLIWGRNEHDQLGDKTGKDRGVPAPAKGRDGKDAKALDIAGGKSHTVSLMPDSTVFAWGGNSLGQLGNGEVDARGVMEVGVGCESIFGAKRDGSLWAWGRNTHNSLGINSTKDQTFPVQVPGIGGEGTLKGVKAVDGMKGWDSNTHAFGLALLKTGRVCAWGGNNYGQLGVGNTTRQNHPVYVMKDENNVFEQNAIKAAAGELHGAALTEDGLVYSWGYNHHGELGIGDNKQGYYYPQKVDIDKATDITACQHNIFIIKEDGTLWGTGYNLNGELGQGDTRHRNTFIQVPGLERIVAIAGGGHHIMALDAHGRVWAWGDNHRSQLGNNTTTDQKSPVRVVSPAGSVGDFLEDIVAISAGNWHSMAVKEDGTVWCWGENNNGRLGYAVSGDVNQKRPGQVRYGDESAFLLGIRRAFAGYHTSFALDEDGTLWSWGAGNNGERGDGETHEQTYPVKVLL
ncbi:hypothetical protein EPICR_140002 [Candidatus Desulfarcum epimagneticum]|uniref:Fibronectin type-III domain-containing protein n=1 Tax=uncultured Desulfobacteraceae bacterium TaxID=218296 RepID=A0A484HK39_9BACT|nr:hypothetical protein EPICR_140002 [uncultured Desulfobacteraceae bacterium]